MTAADVDDSLTVGQTGDEVRSNPRPTVTTNRDDWVKSGAARDDERRGYAALTERSPTTWVDFLCCENITPGRSIFTQHL